MTIKDINDCEGVGSKQIKKKKKRKKKRKGGRGENEGI